MRARTRRSRSGGPVPVGHRMLAHDGVVEPAGAAGWRGARRGGAVAERPWRVAAVGAAAASAAPRAW